MKKITLMILCVCMCISLFACKAANENTIMTYKGAKATESLYSYWMSTYKSNFLYYYNEGIDSDEFWDTLISDDQTYEEYIVNWIDTEMQYRTVALWLFDEYKLELSDTNIAEIDADIAEKIEYAGLREAVNTDLGKLGMNLDMLREVYIANAKYDAVYEYLYGTGGKDAPTDTERADYFKDNYYCLKYITVYSGAVLKTDDDGNYVYDEDGQIELVKLNDEEKQVKKQLVDTIVAGVEAGGDFDEYIKEFSEVDYSEYPDGFFVSENDYSRFGSDIVKAATELEIGGIRAVSDENVTYIIKKFSLPEYSSLSDTNKGQLENMDSYIVREKYTEKFNSYIADIVINTELKESYDIRRVSENSYF
ncbi:MAG: hypothetical protein IKU19_06955 [Clostridia bacterium]|nr:hypothetical protein [Clostridia bacterium]